MTRETKIGLVMVLVLCAAGGFVFYKKYAKQQERAAAFASESEEGSEGDDERPTAKRKGQVDPKVTPIKQETEEEGDPFDDGPKTAQKSKSKRTADDFGEQAEPEAGAEDLFEPKKSPLANKRPKPQPIDDGDPFGGAEEQPPPAPPGRRNGPPPSGFEDAEFEPQPRGTRPGAMTAENDPPGPPGNGEAEPDDFSDPFGGPVARKAPPGPPANVEPEEPGELQVTGNDAGDAFGPPGRATPIPRGRAMPQPAGDEFNPQPRPVRKPAPVTAESDPFGSPNPMPRGRAAATPRPVPAANDFSAGDFEPPAAARPTVPPRATAMPRTVASSDPFAGATTAANDQRPTLYEVQANDNYWSISKKQYGTYRYFDALAKYNAERVPDPTKLRPGMKVMTPPPQALEARFPEMFGKGGAVTASYVPESESDEPGLFRAKSGQPMYRIGPSDTLTTIARAHLGRQSRWIQIFEMNRDQLNNPEQLKVGAILRLPLDASNVRVSGSPLERR
ncbi:MAG: LysM peptidoglycan-binding domain-containing protein [Planctomycetaceae bacterium]|nr:LysM peptidoglycan-binding domain-containing protein [Planctomycetaceae bacterium]